jgi:glycosyltransferase involved in cell wall biosynthesis
MALLSSFDRTRRTLVVLSQVYVPDPASVGQHTHDVASEMALRGWQVVVFTSDRGYEDPHRRYARYEVIDGVHVVRLPFSSFGKSGIGVRLAGAGTFLVQAIALATALPRIDHVLVSTSPPMCALAGVLLSRARRAPMTFWVMDINPDQIVAVGTLAPDAAPVRAFDWMNRQALAQARHVVALDHFMAERLNGKLAVQDKLVVLPPWPHVDATSAPVSHARNPFRHQHELRDKFVVMYSGNLSPSHPISTILEAARRMQRDERMVLLFIGGGLGRQEIDDSVREHGLRNVLTLPYQPMAMLPYSLAAADVHLVSMGNEMVGIVHPCKIYGAMAAGRPVLVLGPRRSHLGEIVHEHEIGFQIEHGDVEGAERVLRAMLAMAPETLETMGQRARAAVNAQYSKSMLCGRFCDLLESQP